MTPIRQLEDELRGTLPRASHRLSAAGTPDRQTVDRAIDHVLDAEARRRAEADHEQAERARFQFD